MYKWKFAIKDGGIEYFAEVVADDYADAYWDAFDQWWKKWAESINRYEPSSITITFESRTRVQ